MSSRDKIIVAAVSIAAGLVTFILVQKVTKKGVDVSVKSASAKCNDGKHDDSPECQKADDNNGPQTGKQVAVCKGKAPPDCFPMFDYETTDKGLWTAQNLKGKVVMVNIWATWCKPCIKEIPVLTKAYQRYKDKGFVILGIVIDDPSSSKLEAFKLRTGLDYPVIRHTSALVDAFDRPRSIPTTFIYDRGGNLRYRHNGPVYTDELNKALAELIPEKSP